MSKRILGTLFIISGFIVSALVATPTMAANEASQRQHGSWIVLSGTVASAEAPDSFVLDYGEDTVRVELDNWNWAEQPGQVAEGDKVKVYGKVDQDTYETATIEADSVYVENLGIHFHGSPGDEEALSGADLEPQPPVTTGEVSFTGRVESIDNRMFTIDTGSRELTVDTSAMGYDPLKRPGLRNRSVQVEDLVTVSGTLTSGVFELRNLKADSVIIRSRAPIGMERREMKEGQPKPGAPATQPKPVEP